MKLTVGTVLKNKDGSEAMVVAIYADGTFSIGNQFAQLRPYWESYGWEFPKEEKWKPQDGDLYYFIGPLSKIIVDRWDGSETDKERYEANNCFNSQTEAEAKALKIKEILSTD